MDRVLIGLRKSNPKICSYKKECPLICQITSADVSLFLFEELQQFFLANSLLTLLEKLTQESTKLRFRASRKRGRRSSQRALLLRLVIVLRSHLSGHTLSKVRQGSALKSSTFLLGNHSASV